MIKRLNRNYLLLLLQHQDSVHDKIYVLRIDLSSKTVKINYEKQFFPNHVDKMSFHWRTLIKSVQSGVHYIPQSHNFQTSFGDIMNHNLNLFSDKVR